MYDLDLTAPSSSSSTRGLVVGPRPGSPYPLGRIPSEMSTRAFQVASQVRECQQPVGVLARRPRICQGGHELLDPPKSIHPSRHETHCYFLLAFLKRSHARRRPTIVERRTPPTSDANGLTRACRWELLHCTGAEQSVARQSAQLIYKRLTVIPIQRRDRSRCAHPQPARDDDPPADARISF